MNPKQPPEELMKLAAESLGEDIRSRDWNYKGMFHQTCAPWTATCYHKENQTAIYVVMEGYRLRDGSIYAASICPVCGKVLWIETSRNF